MHENQTTVTKPGVLVPGLMLLLAVLPWPRLSAATAEPRPWSPEVADVLEAYHAGDDDLVRQWCTQILNRSQEAQVRRDAAALRAMTWMRESSRMNRLAGLAELFQLAEEEPDLLQRPECLLAMGRARLGLMETAQALEHLAEAEEGFAARGDDRGRVEALAELAEAWARHTEWEITPPRFKIPRPHGTAEARRVRREQMARIRDLLAGLPGSEDALARVDLLLAEDFIAAGDRAADGIRVLEQLAAAPRVTPAVAEAIQRLAELREQGGRLEEAMVLYRRLAAEGPPAMSARARRRLEDLGKPLLNIHGPGSCLPGEPVVLRIESRRVDAAELEVRAVALPSWLEAQKGRLIEAKLPEAGSLLLSRRWSATPAEPGKPFEQTVTFEAPPGAYVVIVRARTDADHELKAKRLLIAGEPRAVMLAGPTRGLLWVASPEDKSALPAEARFWMYGSYVPTRPDINEGIACFTWPPETRVMREKRWTCLVSVGDQMALCRGVLPGGAGEDGTRVLLVGGPPEPGAGETIRLVGVVLGAGVEENTGYELVVRDVMDEPLTALPVSVDPSGVFSAELPVTEELADRHLRFILKRGGKVLPNLRGRLTLRTAASGARDLLVTARLPAHVLPGNNPIRGHGRVLYRWGVPVSEADLVLVVREVGLPAPGGPDRLQQGAWMPLGREPASLFPHEHPMADAQGRFPIEFPRFPLHYPLGPAALGCWARAMAWEGLQRVSFCEAILGPEPAHAWIQPVPPAPTTGTEATFLLGCYDPVRRLGIEPPTLEIRDGSGTRRLEVHADVDGWRSEPWRPTEPGDVQVTAAWPRPEGEPLCISRSVTVEVSSDDTEVARLGCRAYWERRRESPGVHVALKGQTDGPVLAALVSGAEPVGGVSLPPVDGTGEAWLPVEDDLRDLRMLIVGAMKGEYRILADVDVEPDPSFPLAIALEAPSPAALPGAAFPLHVRCTRGGRPAEDASLVVRLVPAADSGLVSWLPGQTRFLADIPNPQPLLASGWSPAGEAPASNATGGTAGLSSALVDGLLAGVPLWATAVRMSSGTTALSVPLPHKPGLYRIWLYARGDDGAEAVTSHLVDTRAGLEVSLDLPARLTPGDRTFATVLLTNPHPEPASARLWEDAGEGLQTDWLRAGRDQHATGWKPEEGGIEMTLPPGSMQWIQTRVEAVRPGTFTFRVSLETPAGLQSTHATYRVDPAAHAPPNEPEVIVERSIWLLAREPAKGNVPQGTAQAPVTEPFLWKAVKPLADGRVEPGRHLLVREVIRTPETSGPWRWRQRIPSNCHAYLVEEKDRRTIGKVARRHVNELEFAADRPPMGEGLHEYHLVAVRPGVCRLPWPEIKAGTRTLRVSCQPADLRLEVLEVAPPTSNDEIPP